MRSIESGAAGEEIRYPDGHRRPRNVTGDATDPIQTSGRPGGFYCHTETPIGYGE
jgi:hypothetical protein